MMSKHYVAITPPSPPRPKFHRYVSTVCVWVSMPTYCRICIFILRPDIRGHATECARPAEYTRVKLAPLSHPLTSHRIMSFIGSDLSQIHRWITRFHRFFNVGSTGCILSAAPYPPTKLRQLPNFRLAHTRPLCAEGEGLFVIYEKLDLSDPGLCFDGTAISDVDKDRRGPLTNVVE